MTRVILVRAKADAIWLGTSDTSAKDQAKPSQSPAEVQMAPGGGQIQKKLRGPPEALSWCEEVRPIAGWPTTSMPLVRGSVGYKTSQAATNLLQEAHGFQSLIN